MRAVLPLAGLTEFFDAVEQFFADLAAVKWGALVLVHPTSAVMPRQRWLETLDAYIVDEWEVEEDLRDSSDDIAAVLRRVRMRATVLGEDRSGTFIVSDTWLRTGTG